MATVFNSKCRLESTNIKCNACYTVTLLVQGKIKYEKLAKLLVGSLGMPQIGIHSEAEAVPQDCKMVVLFGETPWCADTKRKLQLAGGGKKIFSASFCNYNLKKDLVFCYKEFSHRLPRKITHQFVPSKPNQNSEKNLLQLSLYYSLKFIKKSSLCQISDCLYGLPLVLIMANYHLKDAIDLLSSLIVRNKHRIRDHERFLNKVQSSNHKDDFIHFIQEILLTLEIDAASLNAKHLTQRILCFLDKSFNLKNPNKPFAEKDHSDQIFLEQKVESVKKGFDLVYYGIIAILENRMEQSRVVFIKLLSELHDEETNYIRSAVGSQGYCYSPLLALFLLLMSEPHDLENIFPITKNLSLEYRWFFFEQTETNDGIVGLNHFIDKFNFCYSESLIENLEKVLLVPEIPAGYQYEITRDQYMETFSVIQEIWRDFFKYCIHMTGETCIVISPWPRHKKYALSLRYDVDRPVVQEKIETILSLQKTHSSGSFATWYFFRKDNNFEQKTFLKQNFQEQGLHALSLDDALTDPHESMGVTYHCGPNSSYWPGHEIVKMTNNIQYTECLSFQAGKPLSIFSHENFSEIWITPLHFPMEQGTKHIDEDTFREYVEKINFLRKINGHIILGSHPDVDQRHLGNFLSSVDLEHCWLATIGAVVERCQKILHYGVLHFFKKNGKNFLCSSNSILDLQLKYIFPDGSESINMLNLKAIQP